MMNLSPRYSKFLVRHSAVLRVCASKSAIISQLSAASCKLKSAPCSMLRAYPNPKSKIQNHLPAACCRLTSEFRSLISQPFPAYCNTVYRSLLTVYRLHLFLRPFLHLHAHALEEKEDGVTPPQCVDHIEDQR